MSASDGVVSLLGWLCYVKRRVMCSHRLAVLTLTRSIAMAVDGFTSPDGCGKNANLGFTAKGCYV